MPASGTRRHLLPMPANPGGNSSAILYDTLTADLNQAVLQRHWDRLRAAIFLDVGDAVLTVKWAESNTGTLRTAATFAVGANTFFQRDMLLQPGRTQISIVTISAPGNWQVASELIPDQSLAQ